jgi:hypothetical protein
MLGEQARVNTVTTCETMAEASFKDIPELFNLGWFQQTLINVAALNSEFRLNWVNPSLHKQKVCVSHCEM